MECNDTAQVVTIVQGEDRDVYLRIIDKKTEEAFDLTNASAINARFKNADDSVLVKTLSTGVSKVASTSGKIAVSITASESLLLKAREAQDFELEIMIGAGSASKITVVQFLQSLTVKSRVV